MSDISGQERELVQYVLGRLPPADQARLEDRYMEDDDLHERLSEVVDQVILAYLSGDLSASDKQQFEAHFLVSPRRREQVAFLRTLFATTARTRAARSGAHGPIEPRRWRPWAAIAAALLVGLGGALLLQRPAPTVQVAALPSPLAPEPRASAPVPAPAPRSHVVARVPRGTTNPVEIDLRSPVRSVRLEVEVDGSHPSYAVRIQTANGDVVWHDDDMPAPNPGEPLLVSVPADAFAAGDSLLAVNGEALRGRRFSVRYGLRVVR